MLTETILLDIASAERQINQLEAELRRLSQPVEIPVDIQTGDLSGVRRELGQADQSVSSLNSELEETERELRRVDDAAGRAGRELDDTGRKGVSAFSALGISVGKASAAFATAFVAVQGLQTFIRVAGQAIDKASDLAESTSKTEVVFGGLADNIKDFANTAPQALGLSTAAALEATSTFGNLFVALGLSQDAAADLSPDIVQLAADLASFNNIGVDEAVEKLRSGLVGEAEPLRALGVNLTEAAVAAKALELGLAGSTSEVDSAAKVQARWALILEQTTTAQGDFARTADGVANTQRTLNGLWIDAQAAIGEALLPAYQDLLGILPGLIQRFEDLGPAIGVAAGFALTALDSFTELGTAIGNVFDQELVDLFTETAGAGEELGFGFDRIKDAALDAANPLRVFNDLFTELELRLAGIDPGALEDALANLASDAARGVDPLQSLNTVMFEFLQTSELTADVLRDFTDASKIKGEDLTAFLSNTIRNADRLKISAAGVRVLKDALVELQNFSRRAPGGNGPEILPGADPATVTHIEATTDALARMDSELAGILGVTQNVAPTVGLEDFLAGFDAVKESMDSARAALHDDQGAIITDLDTFFDNLNAKFAEQLEFARGIATLRSRGQDQLADFFAEQGADALGALQEAIADPAKANEIERTFVQQQEDLAAVGFHAFDWRLKQLILGIEPPEVVIPLTFGGLPDIPISALTAGGIVNGVVTVNINNPTTNDVTTDAARAGQIIGSVSNRTGGAVRGVG